MIIRWICLKVGEGLVYAPGNLHFLKSRISLVPAKEGAYYISEIQYETRTTPPLVGYVRSKDLPLDSKVDVCYDFLNPARNRKVCDSFGIGRALASTFAGVLLILLLLGTQTLIVLSAFDFRGALR